MYFFIPIASLTQIGSVTFIYDSNIVRLKHY